MTTPMTTPIAPMTSSSDALRICIFADRRYANELDPCDTESSVRIKYWVGAKIPLQIGPTRKTVYVKY